jgi:hypothetical protein
MTGKEFIIKVKESGGGLMWSIAVFASKTRVIPREISGYLFSWSKFQPRTSRFQLRNITAWANFLGDFFQLKYFLRHISHLVTRQSLQYCHYISISREQNEQKQSPCNVSFKSWVWMNRGEELRISIRYKSVSRVSNLESPISFRGAMQL